MIKKLLSLLLVIGFVISCKLPTIVDKKLIDRAGTWEVRGYGDTIYAYINTQGYVHLVKKQYLYTDYKALGTYYLGDPNRFIDNLTISTFKGLNFKFRFDDEKIDINGQSYGFYKLNNNTEIPLYARISTYADDKRNKLRIEGNSIQVDIFLNDIKIFDNLDGLNSRPGFSDSDSSITFSYDGSITVERGNLIYTFKVITD